MTTEELDGRIGEGWSGDAPAVNGLSGDGRAEGTKSAPAAGRGYTRARPQMPWGRLPVVGELQRWSPVLASRTCALTALPVPMPPWTPTRGDSVSYGSWRHEAPSSWNPI